MPVTQSQSVAHYLIESTVRMDPDTLAPLGMRVVFQRKIDGVPDRVVTCDMSAADLAAYLSATPAPNKVRGIELTDAIYAWAIQAGYIAGEVS